VEKSRRNFPWKLSETKLDSLFLKDSGLFTREKERERERGRGRRERER